ncbi:MAG TPA: hypothetical protein VKU02_06250 [Gemmataceae bacterium]|nr:hypothetical protein [Gemmataceae bacterium]
MASISRGPNGRRTVQFVAADGKRKSIRLGKVSQRLAEEIKARVEVLNAAAISSCPLDTETARWLAKIGNDLAAKLAAAGLIAPRKTASATLAQWLKGYRQHRADVSEGTNTNYGIIANRLLAFFSADQPLHAISEGDADRWLVWLKQEYAGPTVSKSVKVARQFWAQAIRDGLAASNPFAHLRTPSDVNTSRAFFVDRTTIQQALTACPDHEWRWLLALARYGGLRTPSAGLGVEPRKLGARTLPRGRAEDQASGWRRALGAAVSRVASLPGRGV